MRGSGHGKASDRNVWAWMQGTGRMTKGSWLKGFEGREDRMRLCCYST